MQSDAKVGARSKIAAGLGVLGLVFPIFLLIVIWLPEIRHNYVPGVRVTITMLEHGRQQPSDAVLDEIRTHRLLSRDRASDKQLIDCAEKLLRGRAEVPGFPGIEIHLPFSSSDLDRGST